MNKKHFLKRKNLNTRVIVGRYLEFVGFAIIIFVIGFNVKDIIDSERAVESFKSTKIKIESIPKPADVEEKSGSESNIVETVAEEDVSETTVALSDLIGLLRISKLNLEEAIREGSSSNVLSSALGHMEHTAMPGQSGNCCIAGHRNYTFGKYFNRLNEMEIGDIIEIETYDNVYQYRVYDVFVIEPTQVEVLNSLEGNNLTLITCTPLFVGTHRLIVRAELID